MKNFSHTAIAFLVGVSLSACGGGGGSGGGGSDPPPPVPVAVPNVVGDSQSTATSAITGAGLTVGTVSQTTTGAVAPGTVTQESPTAGTSVAPGTSVNLTVAVAPPNASLGGIWYASTPNNPNPSIPNIYALSDNQGNFAAVDVTTGCTGMFVGQLQANINNVTGVGLFSPDALDPVSEVNCIGSQALQFSGNVSQQSSINLSATGSVNGTIWGNITFTFNPLYNTPSSIASIQGNNWTDGYGGGVLVINPDGTFFEQNIVTGCVINGTITINDPTVNMYNFAATYASCVPPYNVANGLTIVGMGFYNPARPDGTQGLEFWFLGEQNSSSSTVFGYTIFTRP